MRATLRSLARTPGLSLFVIAILAVSIGANAAVYTLIDRILLRPFSFPNLSRMVEVTAISPAEFEAWRGRWPAIERSAYWRMDRVLLTGVPEPENLSAFDVGPDLFDTLGVHARLGRTFILRDHQPGAAPAVVISDRLWRRTLQSDPSIVGKQLVLDGKGYTVVGVMGPEFVFTNPKVGLWIPLPVPVPPESGLKRQFSGVALLAPGSDMASARKQMAAIAASSAAAPGNTKPWRGDIRPFTEQFAKPYRTALITCQAAVALVLLIACANAGGLLLARNLDRLREFAVRAALGAGTRRILARAIAESLLLAGAAALVAVPLAISFLRLSLAIWPVEGTVDPGRVTISWPAAVAGAVAAAVAALLSSVAPCLNLLRIDLNEALKSNATSVVRGARSRSFLVAAEVALALVLASGAGLMLSSMHNLLTVQLGFEPEHVLTARIGVPAQLTTVPEKTAYYARLLDAVRPVPGVRSAAVVTLLPFGGYVATTTLTAQGQDGRDIVKDPDVPIQLRSISPDYFRTVGIHTLHGRTFDQRDGASSPGVVVVNQALARQFWRRTDVIGFRLSRGSHGDDWLTIIGVVDDTKNRSLADKPECEIYLPYTQNMLGAQVTSLVVRTTVPPLAAAPSIQRAIHSMNPDQPVSEVVTLATLVRDAAAQPRFHTSLLAAFAALAMTLAGTGIFAMAAYSVAQRSREIAVRAALGAGAPELFGWALRVAMWPVVCGIAVGIVASLWCSRFLERELFMVHSTDPGVLAASACVLFGIALCASIPPARRAAGADPVAVLRAE